MASQDLESAMSKGFANHTRAVDSFYARRWRWLGFSAIASLLVYGLLPAASSTVGYSLGTNSLLSTQEQLAAVEEPMVADIPMLESTPPSRLEDVSDRMVDQFEDYVKSDTCQMSSLDLYQPSKPLCKDRDSLLHAMGGGGRIGFDAPYQTRGCDMQWYSTLDVCRILHRFDHIYVVGDSLMRHLMHAINILLRADLVEGGRVTWNGPDYNPNGTDCRCHNNFDRECSWAHSAIDTDMVWDMDRASVACPDELKPAPIHLFWLAQWPLDDERIETFTSKIRGRDTPNPREAYIMGHGAWNSFRYEETVGWLDQVEGAMRSVMPTFWDPATNSTSPDADGGRFPRLFVSPNAQGAEKLAMFAAEQNNISLQQFVSRIDPEVRRRGFDHLATYNMSVQASSPDGTHLSMEGNLMKAMMIMNWLDSLQA